MRQLGDAPPQPEKPRLPSRSSAHQVPLLGRQQHLEALDAALRTLNAGGTVTLLAHGRSGAGKSALIHHFLNTRAECGEARVLTGRCYEREMVPFKALDSLIDALSRYLHNLPLHEAQALLPRDVLHLARLFPVLRRLEAVARAPARVFALPDAQEVRRRATAALRELLGRVAERQPLILFIDDLQWGDLDSAVLVADLLRPPDAPALLLLGCYRSEDREASPFLRTLFESAGKPGALPLPLELAVEALSPDEAKELALTLLRPMDLDAAAASAVIARESGGSPFFVCELVQHLQQGGPRLLPQTNSADTIRLDQVIWERAQRLSETARQLLEVVAVCGRPLRLGDAARALGLAGVDSPTLAVLRSGRFLRGTALAERDEIETYHDRIRQTVVANLSAAQLRHYHQQLARVLEAAEQIDPEMLAVHCRGAQDLVKAGHYLAQAAEQAAESLAFDHAAYLYRQALDHPPADQEETRHLWAKLADALANAGRGAEAAEAYLQAAAGAAVAEGFQRRHCAATQYLISGHTDQGLDIFHSVLDSVGLSLPGSPRRTMLRVLLLRLQLWWRGLRFRPRAISQIPSDDLMRFEVCWSAVIGFTAVDQVRGRYFAFRSVLLALRMGEPCRVVRSLALMAQYLSTTGERSRARAVKLLETAEKLLPSGSHPYETGLLLFSKGATFYFGGQWQRARELCDKAEEIFRNRCTGVRWERNTANVLFLFSLGYLGEIAELTRRWAVLRNEAEKRGDRSALTTLNTYVMSLSRLGADAATEAREELSEAIRHWSRQGFHIQHYQALLAQVNIDLYQGDGPAAWAYVSKHAPTYRRALLSHVQKFHIEWLESHARSALAIAVATANPKSLLRTVARDARQLERQNLPWSHAWAFLLRAGIASIEGHVERVRTNLTEAVASFDRTDMRLCAAAARRRLGQLQGGDEGRALVQQADSWMASQNIKNPARMAARYTPGFRD